MGTGGWQIVFLVLAVGIPAVICLYVVTMLVRAVLRADPSAAFLEHLATLVDTIARRWRRPPGSGDR